MSVLVVTGTGTGVGKTVATAALAACATGRVAVVKLAQTGLLPGEPGDIDEIIRLSGCSDAYEFARYAAPLSPFRAARHDGSAEFDMGTAVLRIVELHNTHDVVLVEGAGGLLAPLNGDHETVCDIAYEVDASLVVVTQAGLGTINHTQLVLDHIAELSACEVAGVVIGSWPREPDLADRYNLIDLGRMCRHHELAGVLPAGMAAMEEFEPAARAALSPAFGGTFDHRAFAGSVRP